MIPILPIGAAICAIFAISACGRMEQSSRARPGDGAVIYQSTILTMDARRPTAEAILVKDGAILDLGSIDDLVQAYPGASFDERFLRRTLLPAFVDVRLAPNALNIIEIPCRGGLLTEEIVSLGAQGSPVRIVAGGPTALAAAIEAAQRIPDDAGVGRVTIEARGPASPEAARLLTALGIPLILSGEPLAEDCDLVASSPSTSEPGPAPMISGLIAVAPPAEESSLLGAASAYLPGGGVVRLSAQEALESITIDAAFALGEETGRGVIQVGRRADFAVLDRNPLATPAEAWPSIGVEIVGLSVSPDE
jgi:hypothetical protein